MRRGQRSDIEACARIVVTDPLWRRYRLTLPRARRVPHEAMGRRVGRSRDRAELAVAALDRAGGGFVLFHLPGAVHSSGYVPGIAVAPQARGGGGGTALV